MCVSVHTCLCIVCANMCVRVCCACIYVLGVGLALQGRSAPSRVLMTAARESEEKYCCEQRILNPPDGSRVVDQRENVHAPRTCIKSSCSRNLALNLLLSSSKAPRSPLKISYLKPSRHGCDRGHVHSVRVNTVSPTFEFHNKYISTGGFFLRENQTTLDGLVGGRFRRQDKSKSLRAHVVHTGVAELARFPFLYTAALLIL